MDIILDINECCICQNGSSTSIQKEYHFKNISDLAVLCNGYTVSILSYTSNSINIMLTKGNDIYIRTIYTTYPFEIKFNVSQNCYYIITIVSRIIN